MKTKSKETSYTPVSPNRLAEIKENAKAVGATVHVFRKILVKQGLDWEESLSFAGSPFPGIENPKFGDKYKTNSKEELFKDIILFKLSGGWNKAIHLGSSVKLKNTNPRDVFAISGQCPNFGEILENAAECVEIVSTTKTGFEGMTLTCLVHSSDPVRGAAVARIDSLNKPHTWFAFTN